MPVRWDSQPPTEKGDYPTKGKPGDVMFPGLTIPSTVKAGCLLDVTLLGVGLKIPPIDISIWKEDIVIWEPFVLFNLYDGFGWLTDSIFAIPEAVLSLFEDMLQDMVDDYYESKEEEKT